jgi:hypothetical protein
MVSTTDPYSHIVGFLDRPLPSVSLKLSFLSQTVPACDVFPWLGSSSSDYSSTVPVTVSLKCASSYWKAKKVIPITGHVVALLCVVDRTSLVIRRIISITGNTSDIIRSFFSVALVCHVATCAFGASRFEIIFLVCPYL